MIDWQSYIYPFLILIGIILLIFILGWGLKRLNHPQLSLRRGQKKIKLLEIQPIDLKTKIINIEWEGQNLLIGINDNAMTLLSKKDDHHKNNDTFNVS
jgi:flagellar biogenesis protein FliO